MRRKFVRIDDDSHTLLNEIRRELSELENKDIKNGEIIERTLKNEEIRDRLRLGSKLRSKK